MPDSNSEFVQPRLPVHYRLQNLLGSVIGRKFDQVLDGISVGQLSLTWPDGHTTQHGNRSEKLEENAHVILSNFKPIRLLMFNGQIGFAESYLAGHWTTDSLENLFRLIMNNDANIRQLIRGSRVARFFNNRKHDSNDNTKQGSQRNIAYHYDLGNDFYSLWLDKSMSYSSGIFEPGDTLEDAQQKKLHNVSRLLNPEAGAKVLEIGCGWGAMAKHLACENACDVHAISLSAEQLDYARAHNHIANSDETFSGQTSFKYKDYREITGQFDHIVSIEMFEAVGERYWQTYFHKIHELLDHGGTAVLQIITILEDFFDSYRANPDFIQRYIFPGGMLPTKTQLKTLIEEAGFDLVQSQWFGESYADTLKDWRERFEFASRDVRSQGFDERFLRMWRYYLTYCETGFRFGRTDVGQLVLCKR